jgi:hypothetical protein
MAVHTIPRVRKRTSSAWVGPGWWCITLAYPKWVTEALCEVSHECVTHCILDPRNTPHRVPIAHFQLRIPIPTDLFSYLFDEYVTYVHEHPAFGVDDTFLRLMRIDGKPTPGGTVLYATHGVPRWSVSLGNLFAETFRSTRLISAIETLGSCEGRWFATGAVGFDTRTLAVGQAMKVEGASIMPERLELAAFGGLVYRPIMYRSVS